MQNIKGYDFYSALRRLPYVKAIWLYGSRARMDNQDRSDIDLAILSPGASSEQWRKIRDIIDNADTLLSIDCLRFDTLQDENLKQEILRDKIVLFERIPNTYTWYEPFLDLGEALDRLDEILAVPLQKETYVRDAAIQRFEFCVELFWKVLKKISEEAGYSVNSPKSTLQKAYAMQLIDDEDFWLDMMEDRNLTSHTYRYNLAQEVYNHIKLYYPVMNETYKSIKDKFKL